MTTRTPFLRKGNRSQAYRLPMPIHYLRRLILMYRKTMALQFPHSRIKAASHRLCIPRSLTQQWPWSVMIVEIAPPSGIDINTSRCISLIVRDRSLTLDSRHRKRHDRPLKCDIDDCRLAFAFNRDLQRHIVSVHPKNPQATSQGQYHCHHPVAVGLAGITHLEVGRHIRVSV
jgi:hypothetical protein